MNEIKIIPEFTAEDRERIDRMTAAMERLTEALGRSTCDACASTVQAAVTKMAEQAKKEPTEEPQAAPEKATEAAAHPVEGVEAFDAPAAEKTAPEAAEKKDKPKATRDDIRNQVIALTQAGKKDAVRSIVYPYATTVSQIPEDKLDKVFEKLTAALEG